MVVDLLPSLVGTCASALPAAVLDALPVLLSRKTFEAALAAFGRVTLFAICCSSFLPLLQSPFFPRDLCWLSVSQGTSLSFPSSIIAFVIGSSRVRALVFNVFCHVCYDSVMTKGITQLQTRIMQLAETRDLSKLTYREIASYVGVPHPYSVQQAMNRLVEKGRLAKNRSTGAVMISNRDSDAGSRPLLSIPVLGGVNCGQATEIAEDRPSGFLTISPSTANIRKPSETYALIAKGDSMTAAHINGKSVADGDYVIVQKSNWGNANEGDYVVSRFDNMNNLKKLRIDKQNSRVVLLSESLDGYPPIIIDEQDMEYCAIEGVAIDVVKGVKA